MRYNVWIIIRITIGWIMSVFGLIFFISMLSTIKESLFVNINDTILSIYDTLILIGGIGILKRKNWARVLVIFLALVFILLNFYYKGIVLTAMRNSCFVLPIICFFIHHKVKEQFTSATLNIK